MDLQRRRQSLTTPSTVQQRFPWLHVCCFCPWGQRSHAGSGQRDRAVRWSCTQTLVWDQRALLDSPDEVWWETHFHWSQTVKGQLLPRAVASQSWNGISCLGWVWICQALAQHNHKCFHAVLRHMDTDLCCLGDFYSKTQTQEEDLPAQISLIAHVLLTEYDHLSFCGVPWSVKGHVWRDQDVPH